jgi:hypothetical protein
VRRVAIVGPGLDFVNKNSGYDFYPPQTVQPFAVIDSLAKLGLSDPVAIELYTFDISPRVNSHIERALKNAAAGKAYKVQLPWSQSPQWSDAFRAGFTSYWQTLGDHIGKPTAAIGVPAGATDLQMRAFAIRPNVVARITPVDMNVVFQHLPLPPDQRFDLIIGTDIFVYYGSLEQSLARANVSLMLKPGGYLLSDDKLPDTVLSGLKEDLATDVVVSAILKRRSICSATSAGTDLQLVELAGHGLVACHLNREVHRDVRKRFDRLAVL